MQPTACAHILYVYLSRATRTQPTTFVCVVLLALPCRTSISTMCCCCACHSPRRTSSCSRPPLLCVWLVSAVLASPCVQTLALTSSVRVVLHVAATHAACTCLLYAHRAPTPSRSPHRTRVAAARSRQIERETVGASASFN
jgi:hypothetical protein